MSAIDKDREIAAKATQGEWRTEGREDGGIDPLVDITGGHRAVAKAYRDGEAEHIVRLHNREPKKQRAISALRELLDNLSLEGCCPAGNCDCCDNAGGPGEVEPHSDGCAYIEALAALVALDREEP